MGRIHKIYSAHALGSGFLADVWLWGAHRHVDAVETEALGDRSPKRLFALEPRRGGCEEVLRIAIALP